MKVSRKPGKRWLRLLMASALALTLAVPATAAPASSAGDPVAAKAIEVGVAKAQVDSSLEAKLTGGGKTSFMVKLKVQADTAAAAQTAKGRVVAQGGGAKAQKVAQGSAVVRALQETAKAEQAGLEKLLENLVAGGHVDSFQQFWIVNALEVTGDAKALAEIAARPEVEKILPNEKQRLLEETNFTAELSAAEVAEAANEWGIEYINAPAVWSMGFDGSGVVIANIDTGVDVSHPALVNQFRGTGSSNMAAHWFDAVNGRSTPYDDDGHGTHTTGTAVGAGGIGVAPGAQFIAAKMLDENGDGTTDWILAAGQWVLAPGGDSGSAPDIASNSWGGTSAFNEWFRPTVQAWADAGILPVFANGNVRPGQTSCIVSVPAQYPESFGVGNVQRDGLINPGSCHGPSPNPYNEIKPDVSAPGTSVRSSFPGGGYATGTGTSMAAPHVAGAAALLKQINYSLDVDEIQAILKRTATPHEDSKWPGHPNNGYGYGVINVGAAAGEIATNVGAVVGQVLYDTDDTVAPTISHQPVLDAYQGMPINFSAQVADDYLLGEVHLVIGTDRYPMQRVSGNHRAGEYQVTLPGAAVRTPGFSYQIEAADLAGNVGITPSYAVTVQRGLEVGHFNDFETRIDGWTFTGTNSTWAWGEPTSGPMAAFSGTKVVATNLAGDYLNSANASFVSPPIDLAEVDAAALSFMQWYNFENNWDFGRVHVIDSNGTQHQLMQITGVNETWHEAIVNLTPFAGQTIQVAFQQTSDGSGVRAGWYLDDFHLIGRGEPPAAPADLAAEVDAFGDVSLTWSAADGAVSYVVYRSTSSDGGFAEVGRANGTSYSDATVGAVGTYYYQVASLDAFGLPGPASAALSVDYAAPPALFFDDFAAQGDWTTGGTNNSWQLGVPTSGPGAAFSGTQVWATNLAGNYLNNANAWLMSPPIDLTGVSHASLRFSHWYELENTWDFGYVEVSTDGTTWTQVGDRYTGLIRTWQRPTLSLDAYAGQTIQLRFRQTSDSSVNYAGWYLDNVKIVGQAAAPNHLAPSLDKPAEKVDQSLQLTPAAAKVAPQAAAQAVVRPQAVPAEATVTVVETGISTTTNPITGAYRLIHRAGNYTLRAEAYGHYPSEAAVEIVDGGETNQVLLLTPMPKGQLFGQVTNSVTGEPIAGATVRQAEDGRVAPVTTDANGYFSMNLIVGDYTIDVVAKDHNSARFDVTMTEAGYELNVELDPFVGFEGELKYDDGSAEDAFVWRAANAAYAVRMTPDPGKGAAQLQGATFYFWDSSFPPPGGNTIYVSAWAADGEGGSPGTQLIEPMQATIIRGAWNTIDLSQFGLTFEGDFYLGYEQKVAGDFMPGLGLDESGPGDRSWGRIDGEWDLAVNWSSNITGKHMIRAQVTYAVANPVISSPADGSYTNVADVMVEGASVDGVTITVYNGDVAVGSGVVADGRFAIPVTLNPGVNELSASASAGTVEGRRGPKVTVIYHDEAPELTISSPADGTITNREAIEVVGQAVSPYLAEVTVNGARVATDADGNFSHRVLLNPGANGVTVVATDLATNEASTSFTVYSVTEGPEISNIEPSEDVTLLTGETLTISFTSDPELAAAGYRVILAGMAGGETASGNMSEVAPGVYEGTFTAPENTQFAGATIEVFAKDAAGNTTNAQAAGRLTVEIGEEEPPAPKAPHAEMLVTVNNIRAGQRVMINGLPSRSPNGRIVQYLWDFGDGDTASGVAVNHVWASAGSYTITLTVIDEAGATASSTKTIQVR